MRNRQSHLQEKELFCKLFDELENDSDNDVQSNEAGNEFESPNVSASLAAEGVSNNPDPLSVRCPIIDANESKPRNKTPDKGTTELRTFQTIPLNPNKRKRSYTSLKPQVEQIFEGLTFFFFPNTTVHPARKLRISKAQEFGAKWSPDWHDAISHVVVDKNLEMDHLMKFLKIAHLPEHVIAVSENYPAECIAYRSLLDPRQSRFEVKGSRTLSNKGDEVDSGAPGYSKQLKAKPRTSEAKIERCVTPISGERAKPWETAVPPATDCTFDNLLHQREKGVDDFEAVIRQAQSLHDLPLDEEDEEVSQSSRLSSKDTSLHEQTLRSSGDFKRKFQHNDKFQCMTAHPSNKNANASCPNSNTVNILQQMADYYTNMADEWRSKAYRRVISTLRNHPTEIRSREEALALPGIGDRLAMKIEEIVFTNHLRSLDNALAQPRDRVLQTFTGVYGAGFAQASKWIDQGFTSLEDLLTKAKLTENQRIGIEHYTDFNARIPRAEVAQHGDTVRQALLAIDPAFQVIIGGSYRRGATDSGDIDCVITRPGCNITLIRKIILEQLVPSLTARKFIVAALASTSHTDGTRWMGASRLPGDPPNPWRRLDLLLVPWDEMGAAMIYFTGNDIFNRSLRLLASKKGMRLNQRGLFKDVIRGPKREKVTDGALIEGRSEEKIFEILGVPWRPPEHRNC